MGNSSTAGIWLGVMVVVDEVLMQARREGGDEWMDDGDGCKLHLGVALSGPLGCAKRPRRAFLNAIIISSLCIASALSKSSFCGTLVVGKSLSGQLDRIVAVRGGVGETSRTRNGND